MAGRGTRRHLEANTPECRCILSCKREVTVRCRRMADLLLQLLGQLTSIHMLLLLERYVAQHSSIQYRKAEHEGCKFDTDHKQFTGNVSTDSSGLAHPAD